MKQVEAKAADALLDRRLKINLPAPGLLRLFGKRTVPIWVKRPAYGSLLLISRLVALMGIDLKKLREEGAELLFPLIAEQGIRASRIIAHGMLRSQLSNLLLARPLAWYLRWHMDARQMAELMKIVVILSGAEDFVSITASALAMRMTAPTTGQPTKKGS